MENKKCDKCGKIIKSYNFNRHVKACQNKPSRIKIDEWKIEEDKYQCPICLKNYCKNGIAAHYWKAHGKGQDHDPNIGFKLGYRKSWNKGMTKYNNDSVRKYSETLKEKYEKGELIGSFTGRVHSEAVKKLLSQKLSINNKGGRCKWYDYIKKDGTITKVQGTWELRFAKVLDTIDEDWIKIGVGNKNHSFKWIDINNKQHFYTPDFWSPKLKKYFEIKGFWWRNNKEKMEQVIQQHNNIDFVIIEKLELELYEAVLLS